MSRSLKSIAKLNKWKCDSNLPQSYPLPTPKYSDRYSIVRRGVVTRLKEGENCVATGWQCARRTAPAWFTAMVKRSMAKTKKREKYERQYQRRARCEAS